VRHIETEVLDLIEPTDVHLVEILVRLEPRNRLIVRPKVEVGPATSSQRRPTSQQVVFEDT
jgi:hypothetical protein